MLGGCNRAVCSVLLVTSWILGQLFFNPNSNERVQRAFVRFDLGTALSWPPAAARATLLTGAVGRGQSKNKLSILIKQMTHPLEVVDRSQVGCTTKPAV
jgi:hypothetical protein